MFHILIQLITLSLKQLQAWGLSEYRDLCSCIGGMPMKPALLWHVDLLMTLLPFCVDTINEVAAILTLSGLAVAPQCV